MVSAGIVNRPIFVIGILAVLLSGGISSMILENELGNSKNAPRYALGGSRTITITGPLGDLEEPRLGIDSHGNANILYVVDHGDSPNTLYYQVIDSRGRILVDKIPLAHGVYCLNSALDSQDGVHICWAGEGYTVHYMKLDNAGNILINDRPLVDMSQDRIGAVGIRCAYPRILIDEEDAVHIIWVDVTAPLSGGYKRNCDIRYIKMDSAGKKLIDDFKIAPIRDESDPLDMFVDSEGTTHLAWSDHYNISYASFTSRNNSVNFLVSPSNISRGNGVILLGCQNSLFLEYSISDYYSTSYYFGNLCANGSIGVRYPIKGFNYLLLYPDQKQLCSLEIVGFACGGTDVNIYFSTETLGGVMLMNRSRILTIKRNPQFEHGPEIFDFSMTMDKTGNIHLLWAVNDGENGFQVQYCKIDGNGKPLTDVIRIAP